MTVQDVEKDGSGDFAWMSDPQVYKVTRVYQELAHRSWEGHGVRWIIGSWLAVDNLGWVEPEEDARAGWLELELPRGT